jgi:prevent-host-death family protein
MAIFSERMVISVTQLKARLLELVRQVEREGSVIEIERHGQLVARIIPARAGSTSTRPWEALLGSGTLLADPHESVLEESDFEASR